LPNEKSGMKYYLIAGERSGDLHGANLIKALAEQDEEAQFRAWGGDYMQEAGAELVHHYREMAVMGLTEVLRSLNRFRKLLNQCQRDIDLYRPDVVILIDFAGFNLRIARYAHRAGWRVFYYISPKLWAWNPGRAKKIKAFVDRIFVILPFETAFFKRFNVAADYVGNPVLDAVRAHAPSADFYKKHGLDAAKELVALLPGSRRQEVMRHVALLKEVAKAMPAYQFGLSVVQNMPISCYSPEDLPGNVKLVQEDNYNLLHFAKAAVVASGTATLETALFDVPQVVIYRVSGLTYFLGRQLIKVKYISLVNLIADAPVVKELIQKQASVEKIKEEMANLLDNDGHRQQMFAYYKSLREILGEQSASKKAADLMIQDLAARRA
jgi:lipid-A-disaccharide synthase